MTPRRVRDPTGHFLSRRRAALVLIHYGVQQTDVPRNALLLAVGGSLCAYGEGGRGVAGLGRTRTTRWRRRLRAGGRGRTPLFVAAPHGYEAVVESLLSGGAEVAGGGGGGRGHDAAVCRWR